MFKIIQKEINWGGSVLRLETGKIARQADASIVASLGETIVLITVVSEKKEIESRGFLPLTVNYKENLCAAGKVPGGFFKRETKPTDRETLISRLIDRPLRPLFSKKYSKETQIICTVLAYDGENEPEMAALIGASAATWLAGLPISEPIAGVRVGYVKGEFIMNPPRKSLEESEMDLVIAGTDSSVLMVESEIKELDSELVLGAIAYGHEKVREVVKFIHEFTAEAGRVTPACATQEHCGEPCTKSAEYDEVLAAVKAEVGDKIAEIFRLPCKKARMTAFSVLERALIDKLVSEREYHQKYIDTAFHACQSDVLRNLVIEKKIRVGNRSPEDIRPIECEIDFLPKVHGSALFTRGNTQALVTTTVGTGYDEQMSEDLSGVKMENFIMHYTFPPYSVGEVKMLRAPGRREIGHGKLAFKALRAVMPSKLKFPYTVRILSEVTESDGSSSMATVCGTSLALMSAGVPIKQHVAGIAMGLVKNGEEYIVLSDITGEEDHIGDMDFKVTASKQGITALQMDIKIGGVTLEIMKKALNQATQGLNHILSILNNAIEHPRPELSPNAPRITVIEIQKDKIRDVIGTGGKTIRELCEETNSKIEIDQSGKITIMGASQAAVEKAIAAIEAITVGPEVGKLYDGTVTKVTDFGAFVKFTPTSEGLVHISEIADTRITNIGDFIKEGQAVQVKLIGIDRQGRMKLSIRATLAASEKSDKETISSKDSSSPTETDRPSSKRNGPTVNNTPDSGGKKDERSSDGGNSGGKKKRFF